MTSIRDSNKQDRVFELSVSEENIRLCWYENEKLYDQPVQWPEACKTLQSIFDSTLDLSRHSRRLRYRDIVLSDSISPTAPLREH